MRHPRRLLAQGAACVIALDEVGRGAAAGPVVVGAVRVDSSTTRAPTGIKDSKLLSPRARTTLAPKIQRWASCAVGVASALEVDEVGIIAALHIAALRALAELPSPQGVVILDGPHDWLSTRPTTDSPTTFPPRTSHRVETMVKADQHCTPVAAASIIAKVYRDAIMESLATECAEYGWDVNKGYLTPHHRSAIATHGLSAHHRRSWSL